MPSKPVRVHHDFSGAHLEREPQQLSRPDGNVVRQSLEHIDDALPHITGTTRRTASANSRASAITALNSCADLATSRASYQLDDRLPEKRGRYIQRWKDVQELSCNRDRDSLDSGAGSKLLEDICYVPSFSMM